MKEVRRRRGRHRGFVSDGGALRRGTVGAGGEVPENGDGGAGRRRRRSGATFRTIREGEHVLTMVAVGAFAVRRIMRHMARQRGGRHIQVRVRRLPSAGMPIAMPGRRRGGDTRKRGPEQAAGQQI